MEFRCGSIVGKEGDDLPDIFVPHHSRIWSRLSEMIGCMLSCPLCAKYI